MPSLILSRPDVLIRIGMLFLVLGSLSRWFLHPTAGFSQGLVDATSGLLYGVSIGCLILGMVKNRRRHA